MKISINVETLEDFKRFTNGELPDDLHIKCIEFKSGDNVAVFQPDICQVLCYKHDPNQVIPIIYKRKAQQHAT